MRNKGLNFREERKELSDLRILMGRGGHLSFTYLKKSRQEPSGKAPRVDIGLGAFAKDSGQRWPEAIDVIKNGATGGVGGDAGVVPELSRLRGGERAVENTLLG